MANGYYFSSLDLCLFCEQRGFSLDSNLLLLTVREHGLPPVGHAACHGEPVDGLLRFLCALQKNCMVIFKTCSNTCITSFPIFHRIFSWSLHWSNSILCNLKPGLSQSHLLDQSSGRICWPQRSTAQACFGALTLEELWL